MNTESASISPHARPKRKAAVEASALITAELATEREGIRSSPVSKKARLASGRSASAAGITPVASSASSQAAAAAPSSSSMPSPAGSETPGPIYDDCDEVRRKIRAYLRKGEMNQAQFLRALHINSNSYYKFMGYHGKLRGGQNQTYRRAYAFFEHQRIAAGKPKSKKRREAEEAFGPEGRPLFLTQPRVWCSKDEVPVIDRLGQIRVVNKYTGQSR